MNMRLVNQMMVNGLYTSVHEPADPRGHILYVHGGPGSHGAHFEEAVKEVEAYKRLKYGLVSYDQRSCGRSDKSVEPMTHIRNIDDLRMLYHQLNAGDNLNLVGVFGHSYGAWLAYDMLLANPDIGIKLILAGRSVDRLLSRNRLVLIDLILLRIFQPEDYMELTQIIKNYDGPMWKLAKTIRSRMKDTTMRKMYYWGNLEIMRWYDQLKERVSIPDNDSVFHEVRETMYEDDANLRDFDPDLLEQDVLWINGFHDFLMGGELYSDSVDTPITTFLNSGHYPHLEEADRFVDVVNAFLG